jgi:hypothetical protein
MTSVDLAAAGRMRRDVRLIQRPRPLLASGRLQGNAARRGNTAPASASPITTDWTITFSVAWLPTTWATAEVVQRLDISED